MHINFSKIFNGLLAIGSITGLISFIFTLKNQIDKRSKFKFEFRGSGGAIRMQDNIEFYDVVFDGHVKNQSNQQNSITEVFYYIWGNKGRTKALAYGMGAEVFDASNHVTQLFLPVLFQAREGKHLRIKFSVALTGSHVNALVRAQRPILPGSPLMIPTYEFSLAFKDVNEILFDDKGKVRSQKLIDLWWTLPNTFDSLKRGNLLPYVWHMLKIFWTYLFYKISSFIQRIGF